MIRRRNPIADLTAPLLVSHDGAAIKVAERAPQPKRKKRRVVQDQDKVDEHVRRGRLMLLGQLAIKGATVGDLIGAWAALHTELHGVAPVELHGEWSSIFYASRRVLTEHFGSDPEEVIELIKFAGADQMSRKKGRLTWRSVFNASRVSDYRVAKAVDS